MDFTKLGFPLMWMKSNSGFRQGQNQGTSPNGNSFMFVGKHFAAHVIVINLEVSVVGLNNWEEANQAGQGYPEQQKVGIHGEMRSVVTFSQPFIFFDGPSSSPALK